MIEYYSSVKLCEEDFLNYSLCIIDFFIHFIKDFPFFLESHYYDYQLLRQKQTLFHLLPCCYLSVDVFAHKAPSNLFFNCQPRPDILNIVWLKGNSFVSWSLKSYTGGEKREGGILLSAQTL